MNPTIKSQLFLSLGVESAEPEPNAELLEVTAEDLPEENIEAESSVAEAVEDTELTAEVDGLETQAEDLTDATETLEELDVAVESFPGNITPIESVALAKALQHATRKFLPPSTKLVPAAENFAGVDAEQTKLVRGNLKETAKTFGQGIVANAKKAIKRLAEIITEFVKRFRGIDQRAAKIIAAAGNVKGGVNATVQMPKSKVSVGGDVSAESIVDGVDRLSGAVARISEAKELLAYKAAEEDKGQDANQLIAKVNEAAKVSFQAIFPAHEEKDGKLASKPFPGEYAVTLEMGEGELAYFGLSHGTAEKGDGDLEALQAPHIRTIAGEIRALQKSIQKYTGLINRMKAVLAESMNDDIDTHNGESENKVIVATMTALIKQVMFYGKFTSMVNGICHDVLAYCEKSLAAVSAEPATAPPTTEPEAGAEQGQQA